MKAMGRLLVAVFLLVPIPGWSQNVLPMASFGLRVTTPQDSQLVWQKLQAYLLSNGYSHWKDARQNSKVYILKAEQKISVMITDNSDKRFIEVVFFQDRKEGFNEIAESSFRQLRSGIAERINDRQLVDLAPFTVGKPRLGSAQSSSGLATKQWLVTMNELMPSGFCAEGHPFRRNYSGTEESCKGYVRTMMQRCMNGPMKDAPQTLHSKREAELLGQSLGTCVFVGSKAETSGKLK